MDGGEAERWSAVAADWSRLWGGMPVAVWDAMAEAGGVGHGTRLLDVGCGSGELLEHAAARGASVSGLDPAPGMIELARRRVPAADLRMGGIDALPWGDDSHDVVTAVNALQFADDTFDALDECVRVLVPGGALAVSNWAEAARNDLDVLERAAARARGDELPPDGELRRPGGIGGVLAEAGLDVIAEGITEVVWTPASEHDLARGVLLGEDADTVHALAPVLVEAARRFEVDGGYRLVNAFRWAVART